MIDKYIEFEKFVNGILDLSGEIALNNFRKIRDLTLKGDFSPVTKADEDIEKFIRDKIFEKYPNHKIIGEELDDFKGSENITWYIDPIDGTRSYVIGNPTWSNLISLNYKGSPILGLANFPKLKKYYYNISDKVAYVVDNKKKTRLLFFFIFIRKK